MIRVLTKFTDLAPERQGAIMFLSLEGGELDVALELHEAELSSRDGV